MADRRLQVFHAVAKHGSFTRAADSLFMTQPAVTFQIKQLEEQYNCKLFERQRHKITLTPAGVIALEVAERIIALNDELDARLAELTGRVGGDLIVGASTTLGDHLLPAVLGAFNEQHPQVRLRLNVGNSAQIEARLLEATLDIGFLSGPVVDKSIAAEVVGTEVLAVICDARHPLAGTSAVTARDLVEYEYVSREPGSGTRQWIERYFASAGVPVDSLKIVMELGSPAALKGVVKSGLGFAIMAPGAAAEEIRAGELVTVPLDPPLVRNLTLVMPKERFRSRTISAFVDFVKRRLRAATA